jgi:hypothetical protein
MTVIVAVPALPAVTMPLALTWTTLGLLTKYKVPVEPDVISAPSALTSS